MMPDPHEVFRTPSTCMGALLTANNSVTGPNGHCHRYGFTFTNSRNGV
jgi:hypothetical protein